jgi:hypothetical protein
MNGSHGPEKRKMGLRRKAEIPLIIAMVPKAGFEPARVAPPPPQAAFGLQACIKRFT